MVGTDVMKKRSSRRTWVLSLFALVAVLVAAQSAHAHCDTLEGPVVESARHALESGDITPVLKWVRPSDEKSITEMFDMARAVRTKGDKARTLADTYFFETLVRIHREGEGAPYTGLKPGDAVDPAVALADKALENGSVDELVNALNKGMTAGIHERFEHAAHARESAEQSVEAGRDFVKTYVMFTHYVEKLHSDIKGASGHHGSASESGAGHDH